MNRCINVIALFAVSSVFCTCNDYTSVEYLLKVKRNLESIKSATYTRITEQWNHGDTVAANIYKSYIKEYSNPSDSTIGSKFVVFDRADTTRLEYCYDGHMRAIVYYEDEVVVIDSFTLRPLPFRPLSPPFFNYVKSIIGYAISTNDSISLELKDCGESVYMKLTINEENQIEFFGKPFRMPSSPYTFGDNTSFYELWIDKSSNLPYKVRREMSHEISVAICKDIELNAIDIKDFKATRYFPKGYAIKPYKLRQNSISRHNLLGQKAPGWMLESSAGTPINLDDLKSKVLLIQFTSVSCGPCNMSIPFLKQLVAEYRPSDFDLVAIECTSKSTIALERHQKRHGFDYKFLLSTKEVRNAYSIQSFPVFFVLDRNRMIRSVIYGYAYDKTDKEIRDIIERLM
jgi:thiol-disulfide isomerase/thioredoxin